MNIAGVSGVQGSGQQVNHTESQDSVIKGLQSRIEEIRNQMRELAKNEEMDPKTKADKKAEMQKQISELQAQIRQRQAEMREEKTQPTEQAKQKQMEKQAEKEAKQQAKTGVKSAITKTGANALISAGKSMDISKTQGAVASSLEGKARELAAEIRSDASRGGATKEQYEALADITARAQKAKGEQAATLGKANKEMQTANEIDAKTREKTEKEQKDENALGEEENNDEINTEGKYDKDGNLTPEKDPEEKDFEDKA